MKVIKPQRLGLLCRVYERKNQRTFSVALLGFFPFSAPSALMTEMSMWKTAAEALGKDAGIDLGMPKPRGELLVAGGAFTRGTPRTVCACRVKLGSIDKTVYAIGDRTWKRGVATEPAPFTYMPIDWAHAFGGEGFPDNPLGKGFVPNVTSEGAAHSLPNIEDPKSLVGSPSDRPTPAGFGPLDFMWPKRAKRAGTYDSKWLEQRFPGLADDCDFAIWNAALEDQQIEGYFRGDEAFRIENMHPSEATLEGSLPGLVARCFVTRRDPGGDEFLEVKTRLDTVLLFPHLERGIVLFRGVVDVAEDDGDDIVHLVAGWERPGSEKSPDHYRDVLRKRLDRKTGAVSALRDTDLMPAPDPRVPRVTDPADEVAAMEKLVLRDGALQKNMRRRAEREQEKLRDHIRAQGFDPDLHMKPLPEPEPPPDIDDLGAFVEKMEKLAEDTKKQADAQRIEAEKNARALCEANKLDFDKMVADERKKAAGPPKFKAKEQMAHLRELGQLAKNSGVDLPHVEAQLADPSLEQKLIAVEAQLLDAYRKFAHYFPDAARMDEEPAAALRAEVLEGRARGASFADRDLTGADLAGLDLSGMNLAGAMMESANLVGTDLTGADLTGAVLARADLTDANLTGAKLVEANLGGACLTRTRAPGVDFSGAALAKASLTEADLSGARLPKVLWMEASLTRTNLEGASAPEAIFLQCTIDGARFAGSDLSKARFIEVDISGVDASGATLEDAVFLSVVGKGANFARTKANRARFVKECNFDGASFEGASLDGANLRGTSLTKANFAGAHFDGGDMSSAALTEANLRGMTAIGAMFVRTDLRRADMRGANCMNGVLQRADLRGTNLESANLFRADMLRVQVDRGTNMKGAQLTQIRFVEAKSHG